VLTIIAHVAIGRVPEFKLKLTVTDSASSSGVEEATLCGYVALNLGGYLGFGYTPFRFYRLVYRCANIGNDGTVPTASVRPHNSFGIEGTVEAELEERRLMATEESRQRYGLRGEDYYYSTNK